MGSIGEEAVIWGWRDRDRLFRIGGRSRCAQTKETGFFRAPLPRHRYLVQKPGFSPERDHVLGMRVFWRWGCRIVGSGWGAVSFLG
jgi:hypothetical protein